MWDSRHSKANRASLRDEIRAQSETLGICLRSLVAPLLDELHRDSNHEGVVASAARFGEAWHSEAAVTYAFDDLCTAAREPVMTSLALGKLSAIIASQVGPAAHGPFSILSHAADALVSAEEDLAPWRNSPFPKTLTETLRLEMAKDILIAPSVGRVTVWMVYSRAVVSGMRTVAGPMTFLRPDWALPNAFDDGLNDFAERAELCRIREDVPWLDELYVESFKEENRLVLVRVDLGVRQVAGAVDEARRRTDAVLSVAIAAGGVSWQSASAFTVLLDGKVNVSSLGLILRDSQDLEDSYGMGGTAEILGHVADQLGDALAKGPMPEHLVEALTSIREARMTDHRDVLFYGARPVTLRVATALEDHAMELIASVLGVPPEKLATALQTQEALDTASRRIARELVAPFDDAWSRDHNEGRRELERKLYDFSQGRRVVSLAKTVALQDEIRRLPMSDLHRADFEDALGICTNPDRERQMLDEVRREARLLRARHRRVRNAVNHGLPLDMTTLHSIRDYADRTSDAALHIGLTGFKNGESGATLVQRAETTWAERMERIGSGQSWAELDAQIDKES